MSQTKAQLIDPVDGSLVNADINASAAIAGTKISPDFGSQNITTTGIVKIADGSASNPGLAFTTDTDCGIFRPEANALGIATGGSTRMVMNTAETNFNDGGSNLNFRVEGDGDANLLKLDASTDRVGIGQSTPEGKLHIERASSGASYSADGADILIVENNDSVGIDLRSPAANSGNIFFSDTTRGVGRIFYEHNNDAMVFCTNGVSSERIRITSTGNVGIGITPEAHNSSVTSLQIGGSTNLYDDSNFVILANNVYLDSSGNKRIKADEASRITQEAGKFFFERAGADSADSAITFQRIIATNEDGTVFLKGQATSDNNRMQIRVDDTLATIMASSNSGTERNIAFHTRNTSGSLAGTFTANGLAMPSGKGIDFSATSDASGMTSELLDDYEEGTWTPTFNNAGGFSTNNTVAKYTKIGRVVHWVCQVAVTRDSSSSSGTFTISGLPFTSLNQATGGHGYAGCMGALYSWNIPNTAYQIGIRVPDNTSFIQFFANFDNAADSQLSQPFDANKTIFGSLAGQYITA